MRVPTEGQVATVEGALEIRLRVNEGTRATVSRVGFEGVQSLDETALRSALTIAAGQQETCRYGIGILGGLIAL